MNNIKHLTRKHEIVGNPATALGEFLVRHSNSLEYLVSSLTAYLKAAKADLAEETATRNMAVDAMTAIDDANSKDDTVTGLQFGDTTFSKEE